VLIVQKMLCKVRLVVFVFARMFLMPNVERAASLSYIFFVTVKTCKLIYCASVVFVAVIVIVFSQ
jgi:hypothetical protein